MKTLTPSCQSIYLRHLQTTMEMVSEFIMTASVTLSSTVFVFFNSSSAIWHLLSFRYCLGVPGVDTFLTLVESELWSVCTTCHPSSCLSDLSCFTGKGMRNRRKHRKQGDRSGTRYSKVINSEKGKWRRFFPPDSGQCP